MVQIAEVRTYINTLTIHEPGSHFVLQSKLNTFFCNVSEVYFLKCGFLLIK